MLMSKMWLQPEDEYGSPSLDEIALFSRHYSEEYHKAIGEAAEEVAVEVSSPVSLSMQTPSLQTCSLCSCICYIPHTIAHEWARKSFICSCLCVSHLTLSFAPSNIQLGNQCMTCYDLCQGLHASVKCHSTEFIEPLGRKHARQSQQGK